MAFKDFITGRTNRIVIGSTAGVGIILTTAIALFSNHPLPALRIENMRDHDRYFEVSDHGAIGTGTGVNAFGANGDCLKSGGSSGNLMSWGGCGSGGGSFGSGNVLTIGNQKYVSKQGDTMTGTLTVRATMTGSHIYAGTLSGAGLSSCSNGVTSKLLWNSATRLFSCGTDQTAVGTTYTAGQGLIQTVNTFSLGSAITGSLVRFQTLSGSTVFAKASLSTSGSLKVLGNISGATLNINNLKSCTNVQTDANGRASCNSAVYLTADQTTAGQGLTMVGTSLKVNTILTGSLISFQTVSGSVIKALQSLNSSGSITAEGAISGASLFVGTSIKGAGLVDCQNGTTSKILWNSTTGRFSCGTDADTNTTYTAGKGLGLNGTSFSTNTTLTGTLINFQTVSGALIRANNTLASSGTIVAEGSISGASLYAATSIMGAGLTSCSNGLTSKVLWNSATGRFSCGTDTDTNTTYTAGQGLQLNSTSFKLLSTITGSTLQVSTSLASSGTLVVEGAMSGASLFLGTSLQGAGLVDCSNTTTSKLLWNSSSGRFSCGTDQTAGGSTYTAGQGLTLAGTSFKTNATLTGAVFQVSSTLASSGSIVAEGNISGATLNIGGLIAGGSLQIKGVTGYVQGNMSFGSSNAAKTTVEVYGTLSGSVLRGTTISGSIIKTGLYSPSPTTIELIPTGTGTAITTGSGRIRYSVPKTMSGFKVYDASFSVDTAGTTNATKIQIRDLMKGSRKIFSTPPQIDSGTKNSDVSGTPFVINAANADVSGGDYLYVDFPAVSTTAPLGGNLILYLYNPR